MESIGKGTAEAQSLLWGARPRDWAEIQEGMVRALYDAALRAIGVSEGTDHLDVGCGAGMAAQLAAALGARVTGIDATPGLIEIAKQRTPEGDFSVGEIELLPYAEDSFDTVVGFNSFQFAANPANALREAGRVGRSGAPIAVATWGPPDQCETATLLKAYGSLMPPPPPGAEGPFALSEPGALESFVERAGLTPRETADVECVWDYPDVETALRGLNSAGPGTAAIRAAGAERVNKVVGGALAEFRTGEGGVRMRNTFRYLIATA